MWYIVWTERVLALLGYKPPVKSKPPKPKVYKPAPKPKPKPKINRQTLDGTSRYLFDI